jgi:phytoene dehydrogenase-like protein
MRTANIIGSGPNGLAAAITLAQRGVRVTVYERSARPGGACASGEVTLPGFVHDLGSSVYPLGVASPFFRSLRLEEHGLRSHIRSTTVEAFLSSRHSMPLLTTSPR